MLYLEVIGDTNDADYITSRTEISQEDLDLLMPLIKAIGRRKRHYNWSTSDYHDDKRPEEMYSKYTVPEDEIDYEDEESMKKDLVGWFSEEYVPHGEHGIHTITEINLIEVVSEKNLI